MRARRGGEGEIERGRVGRRVGGRGFWGDGWRRGGGGVGCGGLRGPGVVVRKGAREAAMVEMEPPVVERGRGRERVEAPWDRRAAETAEVLLREGREGREMFESKLRVGGRGEEMREVVEAATEGAVVVRVLRGGGGTGAVSGLVETRPLRGGGGCGAVARGGCGEVECARVAAVRAVDADSAVVAVAAVDAV